MPKNFKYFLIAGAIIAVALFVWTTIDDRTPGETPKASYLDQKTKNDSAFIKAKQNLKDSIK